MIMKLLKLKPQNLFILLTIATCSFQACHSPETRGVSSDSSNVDSSQASTEGGGMVADTGFKESGTKDQKKDNDVTQQSGVDSDEAVFMKTAALGGMMEVELGKIAQKSTNPQVKAFAQQMVTDHTKANDELKQLALEKKVLLPTEYPAEEKAHIEMMKKMTGTAFDKHYVAMMVTDHDKTVALFKGGMNTQTKEVRDFAKKTLPVIMQHDEKAKALQALLK